MDLMGFSKEFEFYSKNGRPLKVHKQVKDMIWSGSWNSSDKIIIEKTSNDGDGKMKGFGICLNMEPVRLADLLDTETESQSTQRRLLGFEQLNEWMFHCNVFINIGVGGLVTNLL